MDTKMDVLWFYWRDNAINEVSSLCLGTRFRNCVLLAEYFMEFKVILYHSIALRMLYLRSFEWYVTWWTVWPQIIKETSAQSGDFVMHFTLNFITWSIFIKFKLYGYHSIALKVFYQTFFESNSIREGVRSQTPDEQPRARKMALTDAVTLPSISVQTIHPLDLH